MDSVREELDLDTTKEGGTWASHVSGEVGWWATQCGTGPGGIVEGHMCAVDG
jgi:hypothetical protein